MKIYSKNIYSQKIWQKRYCKLFKSTKLGLERLEIFETEGDVWKKSVLKILTLDNCIKIAHNPQKNQPNMFSVSLFFNVTVIETIIFIFFPPDFGKGFLSGHSCVE